MGKDASGSVAPLQARRDETASKAEPPCQAPEPLCVSSSSLDDHLIADEVILEDLTECAAAYALPPSAPLAQLPARSSLVALRVELSVLNTTAAEGHSVVGGHSAVGGHSPVEGHSPVGGHSTATDLSTRLAHRGGTYVFRESQHYCCFPPLCCHTFPILPFVTLNSHAFFVTLSHSSSSILSHSHFFL